VALPVLVEPLELAVVLVVPLVVLVVPLVVPVG